MKKLAVLVAAFAAVLPLTAQDQAYKDEAIKHWNTSKDLTLAVAEAMPAGDYGFKPNAAEMSFGQLMDHIAMANANYVSRAAGAKSPMTKTEQFDKATAMKRLTESFDYCIKTIEAMTPEQWNEKRGAAGHEMSGRELVWGGFTHTAHHRGQAEVYLRVKGITPPVYKF
ncbi:MAG: DinB family protein [Bryobacteraceae bacterium]